MRLLISPNRWSCLITSAAMVLDESIEQLTKELGHDGSAVWWPALHEPTKRRSFHIQEIIDLFIRRNRTLTPIELKPMAIPSLTWYSFEKHAIEVPLGEERTLRYLKSNGILTGLGPNGSPHAVAWDGEKVHDPMGQIYPITQFNIQTFWMCNPISL